VTFRLAPAALLLALAALASCRQASRPAEEGATVPPPGLAREPPAAPQRAPSRREAGGPTLRGVVVETASAGGYTYVLLDSKGERAWAAGPETPVAVGDEVEVSTVLPVPDHESRALGRTFGLVYFTSSLNVLGHAAPAAPAAHSGGTTVAAVRRDAARLEGRAVQLRGEVTKATPRVLGRTWLHLRDGSASGDTGEIVVTTQDAAAVGDVVAVRGTVVRDRDFGSGYRYDVLVEDATVVVEQPASRR